MNVYIITKSDAYYPRGGTSDWLDAFTDIERARNRFTVEVEAADLEMESVYLIAVNALNATWSVLEEA